MAIPTHASTFDQQAPRYDARAGLPVGVGAAAAQAVLDCSDAGVDDLVVELGAGTGEVGLHLARLPLRYIGLDASAAMLAVFRAKAADVSPALVVADCDCPWPLPNGSAAVVFASRVIHLLQPGHVAREATRVCRPGGSLIVGRIVRDRDSLSERLRRRRLDLLQAAGISVRHGEDGTRRVIDGCLASGGVSCGRQIVATWTSVTTPREIIAGWEAQSRMGSVLVDPETRAEVLTALRQWALVAYGDLERPEESTYRYVIDVVRLP